jgi:hypothetical protein
MSKLENLFTQFEDVIKKVDVRLKNETYNNLDNATKTVNDSKTLLNNAQSLVNTLKIIKIR